MLPRPLAMAGLLGAAVGVPYAVSNAPEGLKSPFGGGPTAPAIESIAPPTGSFRGTPLGGVHNVPIQTLLQWGVTKEWVYAHWDRKTTGLADPRLFGVRAPVITGGRMTDVAGAISYYFDDAGVLQRIRLHGRTADTTELVRIAAAYGMQRRQPRSPGDQLFQAIERRGQVRAQLRTRPEAVLRRADPRSSFLVDFEATRPGSDYWVQPETPRIQMPTPDGGFRAVRSERGDRRPARAARRQADPADPLGRPRRRRRAGGRRQRREGGADRPAVAREPQAGLPRRTAVALLNVDAGPPRR